MKKLFLLPLTVLALAACNVNPTPTPTPGPTGGLTIDKAAVGVTTNGYIKADKEFSVGGVTFVAKTGAFSNASDYYNHPDGDEDGGATCIAGYGAIGAMQFKKNNADVIKNTTALNGKTKITINWYATYAHEAANYFPVVKQGTEAGDCYSVLANEADNGTDGVVQSGYANYGSDNKPHDIYKHVCTYNISSGSCYFEFGAGGGAAYIGSIIFE